MWEIKGKDDTVKATANALEYNGKWMGGVYVTVTIESPTPIAFAIGDYIVYRGERFEINYNPGKIKSAPRYTKGDAFKYENIKFNSLADELTRCDFLDIVPSDNSLHFTGLPKFSFYGSVQTLADRIQANLDRAYPGMWSVVVSSDYTGTKEVNITVDTKKVWDMLSVFVDDFGTYLTIKGRVITIGAAGIPAAHLFKYGRGNGLYEIEQNAESDQLVVTRLRAYGSTRNLPHRYYNSLSDADGNKLVPDNMAVQNLMLPDFPYTTLDPYIDSANKAAIGIREHTIFFDGSQDGLDEICPSIEGMTAEQLKAAGVACNSVGALDQIVSADQLTDNGVGEIDENTTQTTPTPPTFNVLVKDLGFDINDQTIPGNSDAPALSFKTGMLGGRNFEIVRCTAIKNIQGVVAGYELELNRVYDDGIKLWFPYKDYNAAAEDKFVLLHIGMPEAYIKAALRLKEAAEAWLAKNDYSRSVYAPKIDEIFMARQHDAAKASNGTIASLHDTLKEGMLLLFEDSDLNIDASVFIDSLTIKESADKIPTYEVVLKEEKTVGRLDKMQNQIDSLSVGRGQSGYSAAQIRTLIDAYGGTRFLSKLKDDYTQHKVGSAKAFEVGRYEAGSSGGILGIDGGGDSFAEVARLYVRVRAFFESLTVINADVLAGKQYITPGAGIVCTRVEETDTAYRCYFLSEQDGEKTETKMMAGDQAISQMFNAKAETANKVSNHRYWRLVLAVNNDAYTDDGGNHYGYIDLSKSDCEVDSNTPQPGDHICQLGYRGLPQWPDRPERQTAMVFSTVDADAPSIHMYSGINSFSLSGKSVISFGQDPVTHKVYFRLGASGAEQYLDYKDGVLTVNGKISVTSTIGGKDIDTFIGDKVEGLRQSVGVYRLVAEGEVSPVGCDAAGAVTGAYPVPHVHVYRGMELLTSGVTYAVQSATGIFATVSASGAVTLSAMTADEASVVVTATVDGYTLSMKLTAYKVKPGADGEDGAPGAAAVSYSLEAVPQVVRRNFDGTVTPTSVTISQYATTGDGPRASSNRYFIYFKREGQDGGYGYAPTTQVAVQLTASTTAVVAELRDTAGAVLYRTTVPVLADASGMEIGGGNMLSGTNRGIRNWAAGSYKGGVAKPGKMELTVGSDGRGVRITHVSEGSYDPENTTWQALFHIDPGVLEPGTEYTLSYRIRGNLAGGHYTTGINRDNFSSVQLRGSGWRYHVHDERWHDGRFTFKAPDGTALGDGATADAEFYRTQPLAVAFYAGPSADTAAGWWVEISDLQLERGNVATAYKPHIYALDYVASALRENTTIEGGMILSSLIQLGYTEDEAFRVMSGLSGLYAAGERGGGISYWAGGGCKDAADYPGEGATAAIRQDGTAYFCKNTVKFDDKRMTIGKYAVMDELGIRLLRDDGSECISLTADEYPDGPSDVYSGTAAAKTVSFAADGSADNGTAFLIPDRLLCPAWREDKAATLTFTGGILYCQLTSQNVDDNEGFVNGALVKLVLQGYGDAACTGGFYEADLDMMVLNAPRGQVTSGSMNFANRSFAIPRAGYYRLVARVSRSGTSYASTILSWNGFAATTRTEFYVSRYFANGFCLGSKADEYVSAWRNDNGLFFEARVPDYGIRLVPWGVQCYVNGQWTTQPKMIFRGRANRSGNGYTWGNTKPSSPTPAITVSGNTVTLTFPTAWVNILGGKLGADGLDVTVTPAGTTPVAVACDVKYLQSVTVTMSSLTSFWIELRVL